MTSETDTQINRLIINQDLLTQVSDWAVKNPLNDMEKECVITIMLKILDGKCKMSFRGSLAIRHLYECLIAYQSKLFEADIHLLIQSAIQEQLEKNLSGKTQIIIYELRLLAETQISRPVMKAFKAKIRTFGLYDLFSDLEEDPC